MVSLQSLQQTGPILLRENSPQETDQRDGKRDGEAMNKEQLQFFYDEIMGQLGWSDEEEKSGVMQSSTMKT